MTKRRTTVEIYADLILSVKDCYEVLGDGGHGSKPTKIMYKADMSWKPCRTKLEYLKNRGFVEEFEDTGKRKYKLKPKGENLVPNLRRFNRRKKHWSKERYKAALEELNLIICNQ